jgi:SNF2 family DNA or RNA helicase
MNFIGDYIRKNVTSIVRNRGAWLFNYGDFVRQDFLDRRQGTARYIVRSESGRGAYTVHIMNYDKSSVRSACTCSFKDGVCKHSVAAMLHMENHLRSNPREFNPAIEEFSMPFEIDFQFLMANAQMNRIEDGTVLQKRNKVKIVEQKPKFAALQVKDDTATYIVTLKDENNKLITGCECSDLGSALCTHKVAGLIYLVKSFGPRPFLMLHDLTDEKEKAVAEFGFSLNDDEIEKKFDFHLEAGKIIATPKIDGLVKLNEFEHWSELSERISSKNQAQIGRGVGDEDGPPVIVYVFNFKKNEPKSNTYASFSRFKSDMNPFEEVVENPKSKRFPGFSVEPVRGQWKKGKLAGRLVTLNNENNVFKLKDIDAFGLHDSELVQMALSFDSATIQADLNDYLSPGAQASYFLEWKDISEKENDFDAATSFIHHKLVDMLLLLKNKNCYEYTGDSYDSIKLKTIEEIHFHNETGILEFDLDEDGDFFVFKPYLKIGENRYHLETLNRVNYWMVRTASDLYLLDKKAAKTLYLLDYKPIIRLRKNQLDGFLAQFVFPLMNTHNVAFNVPVAISDAEGYLSTKVYLREHEESLSFTPIFTYDFHGKTQDVDFDSKTNQIVVQEDGEFFMVYRNEEKEDHVRSFFSKLHPSFAEQLDFNASSFTLSMNQLFENEWFFKAFEKIKTENIEILGFSQLSKIKYNPNRAKINIRASSGIDWFDLEITVTFGDQVVSLKDIKKAVLNKQHYVKLGDGTLGMLPQDWLDKYANVLKIGQLDGNKVKLSDRQFSLIEELYQEIDEHETLQKHYEKKQRLRQFENIKDIELPKESIANLRDYQVSGYNWLNFLDEFQWGGILADDMGLGKTLQAITFLQMIVQRDETATNLVTVPKSLVFNWTKELEKFAPTLKVLAYYGPQRSIYKDKIEDYQVIISTYGAIRSDIQDFKQIKFNYIILDESQAIKNPDALVSKSVKLLNAKNRICMSGTPIENNTFDLYSQMDFLNPGMLGGVEFFKKEYANPIDKDKDEFATMQLRKLVYPFILRRTKEEVAKELPPKVESVIYCEMDPKQRKIYDEFKDRYRDMIMGRIEKEGLNNSAMYILEGLLKLRQICDSPALLSGDTKYENHSAKIDELIPRIAEDSGRHKILIFSQFLDMLDLIRQELERLQIGYEYLDGQTTDRMERVENFQSNDECRVFLMSLKAGGVGLNLTAADYVYLIDPWWNPAVEAQAIDRAHRIGQEKSVFAYKMICKDTVEEKILALQEKKKAVAKDIINVETGFIKALDKDDVRDLFM